MQWYIAQPDGSTTGPCAENDLRSWIEQGHYPPTVLVWREGMSEWQQACSAIPSLPPPLPTAAPPQPPEASLKQVWGQAWGQALQEHNEKHGKPAGGSSPTTVQVISAPQTNARSVSLASWILLFVSCFVATIPGLGFAVWLFIVPVLLVTFILGIIAISRGGVLQGILILGATLIGVPLFVLIAPIVTTGVALSEAAEAAKSAESSNQ